MQLKLEKTAKFFLDLVALRRDTGRNVSGPARGHFLSSMPACRLWEVLMAMSVADQPGAFVLDLTPSRELAELEGHLHVLEAQLDALGRLEQVNRVIQFSQNKQRAAEALQHEPFGYSAQQAKGVLEMPMSWQCADAIEELRAQRKSLLARSGSIRQTPKEATSANWFG
jgi:hypothetical protein